MPTAKAGAGRTLLSPTDNKLILIDFQSQMAFATKAIQYPSKATEERP
jgi:hypothetical protein